MENLNYLNNGHGLKSWLLTKDHKRIAWLYLASITVFFAIGRMPGWIAQWLEYQRDPEARITRPRQIYMGSQQRAYAAVDKR